MKKNLLFLVAFISFNTMLFSQTNGWFQYTMLRGVNQMVKDAANNLHIATDVGYIKYNTTTNTVETFFNLTSQSPGVGNCRSVAVNPVNGNVALGYPQGMGIAISDGVTITEYHAGNSTLDSNFQDPELYYAKDGTLYIYQRTSNTYQTFKNGTFAAVKTVGTRIFSIIENNAGTKVYFATSTGLWELVKATGVFTNYTKANSDLLDDTVNALFVDSSDVLHMGSNAGLNTMTPASVWASFQKQVGTTGAFFAVFSIDKNTQGKVLVSNSSGNNSNSFAQTTHDGYSIIDTATSDWTRYDSSTFCNNDNFIASILFIDDTLYCNYVNSSKGSHNLWSFAPGGSGCTEHDLNYEGIDLLSSSGMYDVTVRENPSDNTKLDIAFANGTYYSWILKSMTIDKNFNGTFPALTTQFTNTNSSKQSLETLVRFNSTVLTSERDGIWMANDDGTSTFIPHNMAGFDMDAIKKIATRNTGTGTTDNKITLAIDGFNGSFQRQVFKTECDIDTQICDTFDELFTDRDYNSGIKYDCTDALTPNKLSCVALYKDTSGTDSVFGTGEWSFGETFIMSRSDIVTAENPASFLPVFFLDTDNPNLDGTDSYNPQACFSENIYDDFQASQKCRKTDGTYETKKFDVGGNNTGNEVLENDNDGINNSPGNFFIGIVVLFARYKDTELTRKRFNEVIAFDTNTAPKNSNVEAFQYNVLTDASITLPTDFTLKSSVVNYVYSNTNMAIVINSNYGLLIKPIVDYTSLTLDVKDQQTTALNTQLYPNPATDRVSIMGVEVSNIKMYDINGRQVLSSKSPEFSVKNLAAGMYIVRIERKDKTVVSKKLIKN
jgi:Secretion system C-terminal sorting domain